MKPRMKVFLKLKAQEIGAALLVIAVVIGLGFGGYKLNNVYYNYYHDRLTSPEYSLKNGQLVFKEEISDLTYFLVLPMDYIINWDNDRSNDTKSFFSNTSENLFIQIIWTLLQWLMVIFASAIGLLISFAILYGFYWVLEYWLKSNWEKAGIIVGDVKKPIKKKTRKKK